MKVYLLGLITCEGDNSHVVRFRKLKIPFRSERELETFRARKEHKINGSKLIERDSQGYPIPPDKRIYTMTSYSKKAELIVDNATPPRKERRAKNIFPEVTRKANRYIDEHSKTALAEILGVERATIYSRLSSHKWKKTEIFIIERL